jgi:hypothetical protein
MHGPKRTFVDAEQIYRAIPGGYDGHGRVGDTYGIYRWVWPGSRW